MKTRTGVWFERYFPSSFTFALILSLVTYILGLAFTGSTWQELLTFWGDSFFDLLGFSMQMSLILIFGCVLGDSRLVEKWLHALSKLAQGKVSSVLLVTGISLIAAYINWGLGLVVGAISARKVFNGKNNFPLLVASAYSGFLIWHGGLSGSIPLKLSEGGLLLDDTIFSSFNLVVLLVTIVVLLTTNFLLALWKFDPIEAQVLQTQEPLSFSTRPSVGEQLTKFLIVAAASIYLILYLQESPVVLNTIIFIFLFVAYAFHHNQESFLSSVDKNARSASGIFLQFLFYAGIMGIISKSSLGLSMTQFFVELSSKESFLIYTYISAGVLNFFVPSGGGQWVIQGPIITEAALQLGVPLSKAAMAIAWGDAWTNMIQPFWALPVLKLTNLDLGAIVPYLLVIFFSVGTGTIICLACLS